MKTLQKIKMWYAGLDRRQRGWLVVLGVSVVFILGALVASIGD